MLFTLPSINISRMPKPHFNAPLWRKALKFINVLAQIGAMMNGVMRKPAFYICGSKGADQLCRYYTADQRLYFRYIHRMIPLLLKSEISSLYTSSVVVQPGLCPTWSETPKTGFLTTRLICCLRYHTGVIMECKC